MSLISNRAVQCLQLPKKPKNISLSGVQGLQAKSRNCVVTLNVSSLQHINKNMNVTAEVVDKVSCDLPLQDASSVRELPYIKSLKLEDPSFDKPGRIDLLLGCDQWHDMELSETRERGRQDPIAQNTIFGWAILGRYSPDKLRATTISVSLNSVAVTQSTNAILAKFW